MLGQSAWPLVHDAPYTAVNDRHLMAVLEVCCKVEDNQYYVFICDY